MKELEKLYEEGKFYRVYQIATKALQENKKLKERLKKVGEL